MSAMFLTDDDKEALIRCREICFLQHWLYSQTIEQIAGNMNLSEQVVKLFVAMPSRLH